MAVVVLPPNSRGAQNVRVIIVIVCLLALFATAAFAATTPSSGTVSPASPTVSFTGGPYAVSNPSSPTGDNPPACVDATCGVFTLTVAVPATDFNTYRAKVTVRWTKNGST